MKRLQRRTTGSSGRLRRALSLDRSAAGGYVRLFFGVSPMPITNEDEIGSQSGERLRGTYADIPTHLPINWVHACETLRYASAEIGQWIREQEAVGEESLTDWLLRTVSKELDFVRYLKSSKRTEARETGADWEWWFVSTSSALGMRIQAKRLRPGSDHYRSIAYTNQHGLQIEQLLESASEQRLLAFYCLYNSDPRGSSTRCARLKGQVGAAFPRSNMLPPPGVLVASAKQLYRSFIESGRNRVEASDLVRCSTPLSCFFCCPASYSLSPIDGLQAFLDLYYPASEHAENPAGVHKRPPNYVEALLEIEEGESPSWIQLKFAHEIRDINGLLVFDFRDEHHRLHKTDWRAPGAIAPRPREGGGRALKARGRREASLGSEPVLELRRKDKSRGQPHCQELIDDARLQLEDLVTGGDLSPRGRSVAGDVLGYLGDRRDGIGLREKDGCLLPDMAWVKIQGGKFLMGSGRDDHAALEIERPCHDLELPEFFVSRYAVTNEQFGLFIEADGYNQRRYWTAAGWDWSRGGTADLSPIVDRRLREHYRVWLARRPAVKQAPLWWRESGWRAPNCPVVGVSWFEAMAYAKWLDEILRSLGWPLVVGCSAKDPAASDELEVRLPTEAEWEKAARGVDGRIWPWGNEAEFGKTNTKEVGLEQTCAVGLFPPGDSPYGVADMIGNTWEWTYSLWGRNSHEEPDYRYPYDPFDGREDPEGAGLRAVRGSSWFGDQENFGRCAFI